MIPLKRIKNYLKEINSKTLGNMTSMHQYSMGNTHLFQSKFWHLVITYQSLSKETLKEKEEERKKP